MEAVGWALEGVCEQEGAAAEDAVLMFHGPHAPAARLLLQPRRSRTGVAHHMGTGADLCQYPLEACNGRGKANRLNPSQDCTLKEPPWSRVSSAAGAEAPAARLQREEQYLVQPLSAAPRGRGLRACVPPGFGHDPHVRNAVSCSTCLQHMNPHIPHRHSRCTHRRASAVTDVPWTPPHDTCQETPGE